MNDDAKIRNLFETAEKVPAHAEDGIETVCAAAVAAQAIRWLWPDRIALGKLSLIAGDPGLGKSVLAATLAAHVSRGTPWPVDGTGCPAGSAMIISAEDDVADTIRPRLEAAGADLERVQCSSGMITDGGKRRGLCLDRDIPQLAASIEAMGDCRLVVIDPISAFLGNTDSHANAEVRGVLAQLSEMAQRLGCAVVLLSHLNKGSEKANALYRTSGSLAFVAAARAAFVVARDKDDPKRRLFLPAKNNLSANDGSGLAYRVVPGSGGAPVLAWEPEPVTISADDALASASPAPKPRDAATEWLRDWLAGGPVAAADIWREADAKGFAEATVKRAKAKLGVVACKAKGSFGGGWSWALRGPEGDHEGDQTPEGDHVPTGREVIPFEGFGPSDPLRRGSPHEGHQKIAYRDSDDDAQREVVI